MSPVRTVTYVSGPDQMFSGAGDGNRTHVRSFYTAIVRRPPISLAWRLYITKRLVVQSGHFTYFQFKAEDSALRNLSSCFTWTAQVSAPRSDPRSSSGLLLFALDIKLLDIPKYVGFQNGRMEITD